MLCLRSTKIIDDPNSLFFVSAFYTAENGTNLVIYFGPLAAQITHRRGTLFGYAQGEIICRTKSIQLQNKIKVKIKIEIKEME